MKINIEKLEYECTPVQLAEEFCQMYENEQAVFFNLIAEYFNHQHRCLSMQLEYISQSPLLTPGGRGAMEKIGEYAQHNRVGVGEA